jgi:hypothetical protein
MCIATHFDSSLPDLFATSWSSSVVASASLRLLYSLLLYLFFERGSQYAAQAGLEPIILLPQTLNCGMPPQAGIYTDI